ncbi:uroporphyrinogen-III synthase [Lysobacter sp. TY2-98]|uniref:uroporphyrinogen-III synthase n=1 Tax=Lysobacter sp. TY2-98 TaxID=2290922 RepID=UPI000E1FEAA7|nr:uroporphyrinogen-III synthase [Lysobacter sp. TY2-98]AXK73739.1 uroporphyrinogen-III synthase [Lysobacter sp. TY2-98]
MHDSLSTGPRWYVISLRPRGQHQRLRDVARRAGHAVIALSPVRIVMRDDATTRAALRDVLACDVVVFTSPNAVAAAKALQAIDTRAAIVALGDGTAQALRRAGAREVLRPSRMDSDGVLALPVFDAIAGRRVGLVTAPGGRDRLAPALQARGAQVVRADVYSREPCGLPRTGLRGLRGADGALAIALSSGEALDLAIGQLEPADLARLRRARVLAASERLAEHATRLGFEDVVVADGPRPAQLVAALNRPQR